MRKESTNRRRSQLALAAAAAAAGALALALPSSPARADSGTWTNPATGGLWSDVANWSGGIVADGAGFTADFSAIDLPADNAVTLDGPRTLGSLSFGDTDITTAGGWVLGNGANAANILTLDGGTPTITVNALGTGELAQIDAQVNASTLGFTKAGDGRLSLTNTANTGNIVVSAGTLTGGNTSSSNAGLGAGQITLQGNATLNALTASANTWTMANALVVPAGETGSLGTVNRMRMNGAVSGGGTLNFNVNTTVSRMDLQNNWTAFTGNLNFTGSGGIRMGIVALASGQPNFNSGSWASTSMDLGGSVVLSPTTNSTGNTLPIGALSGSSTTAALGGGTAGSPNWTIGAKNLSTTYAGGIRGNSSLTKTGTGSLVLTNTSDLAYTGATNVNAGVLQLDGAKTGAGAVNVNNNGTLAGSGTISAGLATVASGGRVTGGSTTTVGTLNLSSLTLNAGSLVTTEFNGSANDLINVTTSGGLTINGGSVSLLNEGAATTFSTDGTYNLIGYSGAIAGTGIGALSIANPESGKVYTFGESGSFVTIAITSGGAPIYWNQSTGGTWGSAGNWTGTPPNAQGAFAGFGGGGTPIAGPATVTLDGDKTVGTVSFNSANSFTIAQGSGGSLLFDNASAPGAITNALGNHTISASVSLNAAGANVNVVNAGESVTLSGSVSGVGAVTNVGAGNLVLAGSNPGYTGTASASAGKLVLGHADALSAGTLAGGAGSVGFTAPGTFNVAALGIGTITTVDAGTIAVGGNNASTTFAGSLAGPAALAKTGTGTLTLTGASSHAGGLKVEGGTVVVKVPQTYGGNTTVAGGATLALDTGSSIQGSVTLANGATFNMLPTGGSGSASIFPGNPLILETGATATINSVGLANGYNGPVTGDATSTLLVTGQTSVSASGTNQQFLNHVGTVRVDTGSALRFGATSLNNGGPSTTFEVNGTLQTRNGGAVALGAITGTGTIMGANNASGNVTYTIGGANSDTTFSGIVRDGSAVDRLLAIAKTGTGTLTLSGVNTYTGGTTVNGGTLAAASVEAFGSGSLTVNDTGAAVAQPGLPTALTVTTLTTTGSGKFDLTDNDLVIRSSTLAAVTAQIVGGFNLGTWDGGGITSSAAATDENADTALGFVDNAELGLTSFANVTLTGPEILVKYTYYGDADLTGVVDTDDFQLFLAGYQDSTLARTWLYGDFDYNSVIDTDDFQVFLYGYQNQGGPLSELSEAVASAEGLSSTDRAFMQAAIAAVPEPASLGVLALAGTGLLGRRNRRRATTAA